MKKVTTKKGAANRPATGWGFDPKNIDPTVRPQDDLYQWANGGWIKRNPIPKDESRWGAFNILRFNVEQDLHALVLDMLRKKYPKNSPGQLVGDMYRSAIDYKKRNQRGLKPLLPYQKLIRDIDSPKQLLEALGTLHRLGISVPWEFYLDQDSKNSARYLLHLTQDGIGMPDREYYLSNEPEQKRVREAYKKHVVKLLTLAGQSPKEARASQEVVLEIETALAKASMKKEDTRDSEKTYHVWSVAKLSEETSFDWARYFAILGASNLREVNVSQPEFFKQAIVLLEQFSLAQWRTYLEWHLINECATLLSEEFVKTSFAFYGTVLTGSRHMRAPWRRALGATNGAVGEALANMYVERHFTKEAKARMDDLVSNLFAAYEARIKELEWMSPATKKKAVLKLRAMNRKIGAPTKFEQYKGLNIDKSDYFGNVLRAYEFQHRKLMRKLSKVVDRNEWFMLPQTVNAYCHFNLNEIVFPAAILQAPFFSLTADDAVNYGAIGSVIGHEITHGFDDQGSKFDAKGNMRSWWGSVDKKRFESKAEVVVKQFNAYTIDGVRANGKLTLGENIADLGGLSIAWDAYTKHMATSPAPADIDGFNPAQRFFLGFAQAEQEVTRPEFRKLQALNDPHSAAHHRVNGPVSNFEPFYEAFGVKKGDKLYRDPKTRAKIW